MHKMSGGSVANCKRLTDTCSDHHRAHREHRGRMERDVLFGVMIGCAIPVACKGINLDCGYRIDCFVDGIEIERFKL